MAARPSVTAGEGVFGANPQSVTGSFGLLVADVGPDFPSFLNEKTAWREFGKFPDVAEKLDLLMVSVHAAIEKSCLWEYQV